MTQTSKRIILRKFYKPSKYFFGGSGVTFVVMLYVNGNRLKSHFGRHASLVAQLVKSLPAMWETRVWFLGWEDPWRRERLPLQYSALENLMDCIVHGVSKSRTQLSNSHFGRHRSRWWEDTIKGESGSQSDFQNLLLAAWEKASKGFNKEFIEAYKKEFTKI